MFRKRDTKRRTHELKDDVTAAELYNCTVWKFRRHEYDFEKTLWNLEFLPKQNCCLAVCDGRVHVLSCDNELSEIDAPDPLMNRPFTIGVMPLFDDYILTYKISRDYVGRGYPVDSQLVFVHQLEKAVPFWRVSELSRFDWDWYGENAKGNNSLRIMGEARVVRTITDLHLAVGLSSGGFVVYSVFVEGNKVNKILQIKYIKKGHNSAITDMVRAGLLFVTLASEDKNAKVWDVESFALGATLKHSSPVTCAASDENLIVTACDNGDIFVRKNEESFPVSVVLRTRVLVDTMIILDGDTILISASHTVGFLSISQRACLSKFQVHNCYIRSICVLGDGRIALGGSRNLIHSRIRVQFFKPPENVSKAVSTYIEKKYPNYAELLDRQYPLRAAWIAVREDRLTLREACNNAISETNCTTSIDEWCFAHNLLMEAVGTVVPASRHYKTKKLHWLQVLYKHASKLAMGVKDTSFVTSLFVEAEKAGVIAVGGADDFIHSVEVRKDMEIENRMVVNAIWLLFVKQAETDERLREVLHYQRVQQLGAVINAVLGCVPVAGAIATNVLSGGLSVLNDFQVCGLVESLIGVTTDFSAFGTEPLVDRFLRRSVEIMDGLSLVDLEPEKRQVLENAASSLSLTVPELCVQLKIAAMTSDKNAAEESSAIAEEPGSSVVDANTELKPDATLNNCIVVGSMCDVHEQNQHTPGHERCEKSNDCEQLLKWKVKKFNKTLVMELETADTSSLLSAYLVNFQERRLELFIKLRDELEKQFEQEHVIGRHFVGVRPELTEYPVDLAWTAITNVNDSSRGLVANLISFVRGVNS